MVEAAPDRVAIYGIENHAGTPVYVHAKICVIDDTWATIGSDNFNRRSWTHDSELSAVVVDRDGRVRPRRCGSPWPPSTSTAAPTTDGRLRRRRPACSRRTPRRAAALDAWHAGGQVGPRPPGRLRRLQPPELGRVTRALALAPYLLLHDPDGRPKPLRKRDEF